MTFLLTYLKRLSLLILIYTTSRVYFYINNIESFNTATIIEFIEGWRFDISALIYINIPFFILVLLLTKFRGKRIFVKFSNFIFYALNIPFILLNNIDIEYFRFTQKRSTSDLFYLLQLGEDAKNIIPQYLKNYWLITLFSIIQVWLLLKIKNIPNFNNKFSNNNALKGIFILITGLVLLIIGARGGLQLKPINPINAGELSNSSNTSLILNTPFCILHSLDEKPLKKHNYFHPQKLKNIYSPIHSSKNLEINKKNIVIIILESYSKEFVGFYNNGIGYTPFLDM